MDENPDGDAICICIYESVENCKSLRDLDTICMDSKERYKITRQDGMALSLSYGDCLIQKAEPLIFAPENQ